MSKTTFKALKAHYKPLIRSALETFKALENGFITSDEGLKAYDAYYDALLEFAAQINATPYQAARILNL